MDEKINATKVEEKKVALNQSQNFKVFLFSQKKTVIIMENTMGSMRDVLELLFVYELLLRIKRNMVLIFFN